jgi:hypothetical protein
MQRPTWTQLRQGVQLPFSSPLLIQTVALLVLHVGVNGCTCLAGLVLSCRLLLSLSLVQRFLSLQKPKAHELRLIFLAVSAAQICKMLISARANLELKLLTGATPLFVAASNRLLILNVCTHDTNTHAHTHTTHTHTHTHTRTHTARKHVNIRMNKQTCH